MFRSGPLKGGLQEKIYFLLGCVRFASGKYDFIDRYCFLHNFFGLFREALASRFVGLTEACLLKKAEGEGEGKF